MSDLTKLVIAENENDMTLGEVLKRRGFSRRLTSKLKRTDKGMTRNGLVIRTVDRVYSGEQVLLKETDCGEITPNPHLNVKILYEDGDVIVFDKPWGVPVHQSIKHREDTLANFFASHCPDTTFRPVNRLDRDTSGCVVAAKNQRSAYLLQRNIQKVYMGIIPFTGLFGGRICAPIAREKESIILRCVRSDGQYAATNWKVVKRYGEKALCEFYLETGRTHQIRVHCAYKGCPLMGDEMYGGNCEQMKRQALHCSQVSFIRPSSGEIIAVKAELPQDFIGLLGDIK